jgi:hypothetical protein
MDALIVGLFLLTTFAGLHHATGGSRADLIVVTLVLGVVIIFARG